MGNPYNNPYAMPQTPTLDPMAFFRYMQPMKPAAMAAGVAPFAAGVQTDPLSISAAAPWPGNLPALLHNRGKMMPPANKGTPAPATATPGSTWDFATGSTPGGTPAQNTADAKTLITQMYPGARITSSNRTQADQERLRAAGYAPARNSQHLRPGRAVDFLPPEGTKGEQVAADLKAAGWYAYYDPKRGHVHADLRNMVSQADAPWTMPQLPMMDPGAANAMPMPGPARTIDLADPAKAPLLPDRPAIAELPVEKWMAMLQGFAPPAFDEKAAKAERLGEVINGMVRGAAMADPSQGVGQMLAMMGAGASAAQQAWTETTKNERREAMDAQRLFALSMAKTQIDFSRENADIQGKNLDRKWEDQRGRMLTQYENEQNAVDTKNKEILANNGIMRDWDSEMLQARTNRARTALSIMESNAATARAGITGQAELDLKRFLYEDEKSAKGISDDLAKRVQGIAAGVGIDPRTAVAQKDPTQLNALQGFAYMAAKNKPAAINALGREAILSGQWKSLVTDPTLAKQIELAAKQDPELAAVMLGAELNKDERAQPGTVLGLASVMSQMGLPYATAFARLAKPTTTEKK